MTGVKIIDLKGLPSEEGERRLFEALEALRTGQRVQVSLEFNPLSLVYSLKAGGEFRVEYLQQGPGSWLLELTREAQPPEKREQLKELLRQARQGALSEEGRQQARDLLRVLDVATLALLERELAREGLSQAQIRELLRRLHLEALGDSLASRPLPTSGTHPVRTLMEEHRAILAALDSLEETCRQLERASSWESARGPLERLQRTIAALERAESHHRREEEVIFPRLQRLGVHEPPETLREDHRLYRRRLDRLARLAEQGAGPDGLDFGMWRCELVDHGQQLVRQAASHILKEDNVLYRTAIESFRSEDWEQVRRESDAIGYCRFIPEPPSATPAASLDLRTVPLLKRQARVLGAWRGLESGSLLRLVHDREPRPLYYLFQATQRGRFQWTYEREGPEQWVALIRKL